MRIWIPLGMALALIGCGNDIDRTDRARTQVTRWVEKLDGDTTPAGAYKRFAGERLPEADP